MTAAEKLEGFQTLVNRHPPVLREWFRTFFSDPQEWYTARSTFTRTCAVMSMVGYLIGLGDRHGENILLDSISGDVVHVDFNCLFNKVLIPSTRSSKALKFTVPFTRNF